ncbi:MAG: riboflavin synthase [Acidimicrobiia bacterium]
MFTGIVSELGTLDAVEATDGGAVFRVSAPVTCDGLTIGDSIAVNGVCLTAIAIDEDRFTVEAISETLQRTNLGDLASGSSVDLERPVEAAGGRFDGHVVQGHVDGVGTVQRINSEGSSKRFRVSSPPALARYLVEKGSVTIDGVSLTITAVSDVADIEPWFEFALIPHTLEVTVLGRRTVGDRVNLEADILAKYVERLMEARG